MFLDALGLVSDAQAFGAAAVSTNSIDLGLTTPGRQIGTGEPMGFGVGVDVLGTVAPSLIEVISATDAALTAGILVHASRTIPLAEMVAGALFFIAIPPGTPTQRFLGIRITTAGGTVTCTAWLTTHSLFSILPRAYPKNFVV
jgi:hypothetical protein